MGVDRAILRFGAGYRSRDDMGSVLGIARFATSTTVVLSIASAVILAAVSDPVERWLAIPGLSAAIRVSALAVPAIALGEVWRAGLRAYQDVRLVVAIEQGLIPGGTIAAIVALVQLGVEGPIAAIFASTLAAWVGAVIPVFALRRLLARTSAKPAYHRATWAAYSAYLAAEGGLAFLFQWADQLILAALLTAADVGVYAAASRVASLVALPLVAVNLILGPNFAVLDGVRDLQRLREYYARYTWATAIIGGAIAIVVLLGANWLMAFFGPEFAVGATALGIMVVGQAVNSGTGSAGLLLGMTGHVRWMLGNAVIAVILSISLNLALIPRYGITGSAIADAATLITVNLLQVLEVRFVLGFWGYDPKQLLYWVRTAVSALPPRSTETR
jgi:O-antigen/teichoic acid export membrane protein